MIKVVGIKLIIINREVNWTLKFDFIFFFIKILKIFFKDNNINKIISKKFTEIKKDIFSTSSKLDKYPDKDRKIVRLRRNDIKNTKRKNWFSKFKDKFLIFN